MKFIATIILVLTLVLNVSCYIHTKRRYEALPTGKLVDLLFTEQNTNEILSEIISRNEAALPYLMKYKGDDHVFVGGKVGNDCVLGMNDDSVDVYNSEALITIATTNEIIAIYAIEAIYYNNIAFSDGVKLVSNIGEYNPQRNTRAAWVYVEKWYVHVRKQGLASTRKAHIDPLDRSALRWNWMTGCR